MADVIVSELARAVGIPVTRLLHRMAEAGLPHDCEKNTVSDNDKEALLIFLKGMHGEPAVAPKKITLKRKTLTSLTSDDHKKRSIAVEIRQRRTYIKHTD